MTKALLPIHLLLLASGIVLVMPATASELLTNWKFKKEKTTVAASTDTWETVSIPHTWNAVDAQNGGGKDKMSRDGYYRGPASYAKILKLDKALAGKRLFLRFEAVSTVSDVYLNGMHLGNHIGAFGAFCYEITHLAKLGADNDLRVMANNAWNADIPPLSGDFPIFGGIYRPVHLLVENPVCISPLRRGSHGVFLHQENVSKESATLSVTTLIDNAQADTTSATVTVELLDAAGKIVGTSSSNVNVPAGKTAETSSSIILNQPHLWNGRKDPYLYLVKVSLQAGGKDVDGYQIRQGFRFYRIDGEKGFFLNGKSYPLWGVNYHQCREDKGWALSPQDHKDNFRLIDEMGVRAIRLAHYPHAEGVYDAFSELGILVTCELPLVDCVTQSDAFDRNTTLQMNEMIDLYANHTSVFAYGLFNEIYHKKSANAQPILQAMHKLCKERDSGRFTYGGSNQGRKHKHLNTDLDYLAFNGYPGWYGGQPSGMEKTIKNYYNLAKKRGIAISEYGAGASILHHEVPAKKPKPSGKWHPEEWQAILHEIQFAQIKRNPCVWGSFVWNMFDFCSVWRNEGDRPGINDKGLVTHDRQTRKDAFFFYKANFRDDVPVLHLTSKRFNPRTRAATLIKAYSNQGDVTLTLNGEVIGTKAPNAVNVVQWDDVTLKPGDNVVTIKAGDSIDTVTWKLDENAK